jgi:hypothetical protein
MLTFKQPVLGYVNAHKINTNRILFYIYLGNKEI